MNGLTDNMKSSGKYEKWEEGECTLHRWPKSWEILGIILGILKTFGW